MAGSQYPLLRKGAGVSPDEHASRWAARPASSTSTATALQPSTASKQASGALAVSGSVKDRARAYEQRYAGQNVNSRAIVANNLRAAKSSNDSQKAAPATATLASAISASSDEDKENPSAKAQAKALTRKSSTPNIYELPKSRPVSYVQPIAPPLSPRKATHDPKAAGPASPGHRGSTIQAGAFIASRQRANSTPRPSEWMSPRGGQASVDSDKPVDRQIGEARAAPIVVTGSAAADPVHVQLNSGKAVPSTSAGQANCLDQSIPKTRKHLIGPRTMQSSDPAAVRPMYQRSMTEKPERPTSMFVSPTTRHDSPSASGQVQHSRPVSTLIESAAMDRAFSAPQAALQTSVASGRKGGRQRSATLTGASVEIAFEEMIHTLNLPSDVARKMLSVDLNVKTGMLKSGHTGSMSGPTNTYAQSVQKRLPIPDFEASPVKEKKRPAVVRKMKSFMSSKEPTELPEGFMLVHTPSKPSSPVLDDNRSQKTDAKVRESAAAQAHMLKTKSVKMLDPIKDLRKLRIMLRNESLAWIQEWARLEGYKGLMERLWEVLSVEWREEQHDDAVLLELLKCFRGLLMTEVGRACLASCSPSPYRPLVELLFSEKKPGDLAARQCIVELLHGLFAVFPSGCAAMDKSLWRQPWSVRENFGCSAIVNQQRSESRRSAHVRAGSAKGSEGSSTWESAGFDADFSFVSASMKVSSPAAAASSHALVQSLLLGPPNEKEEAKHDFIRASHGKRPYKLWMDEIIGVLSDYFWIFCHTGNTYWRLQNIEEGKVEEPKVPGGMTGGVEFEAMEYCASHLRLLNQLLRTCPTLEDAQTLHADLFASGLEKVILTLRKCSTTYYPQIHLELARYVDLCLSSGYPLHPSIRKHIEPVTELSKSLSAGTIARMHAEEKAKQQRQTSGERKKGHSRSRTEGQPIRRAA